MATENTCISILHLLWLADNRCEISKEIVHTVSQIACNPWSNTEQGHLLEANWSNNFKFIQRLAKSLWILKDTEIKSPLTRLWHYNKKIRLLLSLDFVSKLIQECHTRLILNNNEKLVLYSWCYIIWSYKFRDHLHSSLIFIFLSVSSLFQWDIDQCMTIEDINQRTIFISPQNLESFSLKFTQLFLHEIKMNGKSQLYTIAAALSFMTRDENNSKAHIASI